MRIVTASEMREIDRKAIEEFGVPSLDLMEKAGAGAAHTIAATAGLESGQRIVVLCGKGNNGGDGFVCARYLQDWGASVTAWVIGERDELSADTLRNLVKAEDTGVVVRKYVLGESDEELAQSLADVACAVDALLGTGSKGQLRDPIRRLARILNESGARTYALDMPTGMNADSGAVDGDCIDSVMTITFGFPKRGLYALPGRDLCGDITVVDLGYPEESVDVSTGVLLWEEMRYLMPRRDPRGHKGTFGQVTVVAGAPGMIGAACLSADAALRSGAGLVKLVVPESLADIASTKLTEVMVFGVPESEARTFGASSIDAVAEFIDDSESVLLGPGISRHPQAQSFVRELLPRVQKPLVLDADGLNAFDQHGDELSEHLAKQGAVLTPHPGELGRLVGESSRDLLRDSVASAQKTAAQFRCDVVFKATPAVVASPDGTTDLCSLGNDGMATAGSGDVLAGLIAGLLAQGYDAPTAARVGIMVHARAGDICRGELGRRGMTAGDMIRCLPYAWRELEVDPHDQEPPEELGEESEAPLE